MSDVQNTDSLFRCEAECVHGREGNATGMRYLTWTYMYNSVPKIFIQTFMIREPMRYYG